jgi:hypothetical protein
MEQSKEQGARSWEREVGFIIIYYGKECAKFAQKADPPSFPELRRDRNAEKLKGELFGYRRCVIGYCSA